MASLPLHACVFALSIEEAEEAVLRTWGGLHKAVCNNTRAGTSEERRALWWVPLLYKESDLSAEVHLFAWELGSCQQAE